MKNENLLPRIAVSVSVVTAIANLAYNPTSIVQWCIFGLVLVATIFYVNLEIESNI